MLQVVQSQASDVFVSMGNKGNVLTIQKAENAKMFIKNDYLTISWKEVFFFTWHFLLKMSDNLCLEIIYRYCICALFLNSFSKIYIMTHQHKDGLTYAISIVN